MKILSVHIVPFINYATLCGVCPPKNFLTLNGISSSDGTAKITRQQFTNVLQSICSGVKNEKLGLSVGKSLDFVTLGVIHQISLKSDTIEEGLYYCHSFLRNTFPYVTIKNRITGTKREVKLSINGFSEQHSRVILETAMMVMQRELQLMWNKSLKIECTSPFWDETYPDNWRSSQTYSISFVNKVDEKIRDYTAMNLNLLLPTYLKFLERLKGEKSFASRVKVATLSLARPSLPGLPDVASQFNCSVRGFQRMLATERTTYRQLVDEIKSELSVLLLKHEAFSVADVGSFLGYSESAAFVRTFSKWYRISPAKYRRTKLFD